MNIKKNFKHTQFIKLLSDNIKFMEKLSKNVPKKITKPDLFIPVSMNLLSNHEYIKNIVDINELLNLPVELINNKNFLFAIEYLQNDTKLFCNLKCPINKEKIDYVIENYKNNIFKNIKLEYLLLYDLTSDDSKKKYEKQMKYINEDI